MGKVTSRARVYFNNLNPITTPDLEKVNSYTALYHVPTSIYSKLKKRDDFKVLLYFLVTTDYNNKILMSPQWRRETIADLRLDAPRLTRSIQAISELGFIEIKDNYCTLNPYLFFRGRMNDRDKLIKLIDSSNLNMLNVVS